MSPHFRNWFRMSRLLAHLLAPALLLAGCGAGERPSVTVPDIAPPPGRLVPVLLLDMRVDIPRGTDLGGYEFGMLCAPPYQRLGWTTARQLLSGSQDTVADGLADGGLDVAGQSRRPFDAEEDMMRAEMQVAGRVTGLRVSLCHSVNWLTGWTEGASGEAVVRVEWSLFDRLTRRTLMTEVTEGRGETDGASLDGEFSAVHAALYDAAERFARSPQLRLRLARDPEGLPRRAVALETVEPYPVRAPADTLAVPAPDGTPESGTPVDGIALAAASARWPILAIPAVPPYATPLADQIERVRQGNVLVAAGIGHGSGLFIADGLVLTNAHVVGDAARVRVVTADGTALVGTVERREPVRDVALIRVPRGDWAAMPVNPAPPRVSEDVFALGAPLRERHRDTLTRGIVSAWRTRDGGLPFIQADVGVQPGSSGGPLLDARGNVVGITVSAILASDSSTGLNYFIPIADALRALEVTLAAASGEQADGQ